MHETRYDWLADRWVIFAPNREDRPNEFRAITNQASPADIQNPYCPFCSGAESATPAHTLVLPPADLESSRSLNRGEYAKDMEVASSWLVRVVPNKFPAMALNRSCTTGFKIDKTSAGISEFDVSIKSSTDDSLGGKKTELLQVCESPVAIANGASHLFLSQQPSGCHEVIVESPKHVASLTSLSCDHIELVLDAYRRRLLHWRSHPEFQFAVVFKNFGADAGASLSHTHSQLICLDFVPSDVQRTHSRLVEHYEHHGSCYICQVMQEEIRMQDRIVAETEHFVVLCPFASRFPFAFSIIPRAHRTHFENINQEELRDFSKILRASLQALELAHPEAAYNYVLQSSPFHKFNQEAHHWRLRVIPRLSKVAGFEWGSDCFINTIKPEIAATILRDHMA